MFSAIYSRLLISSYFPPCAVRGIFLGLAGAAAVASVQAQTQTSAGDTLTFLGSLSTNSTSNIAGAAVASPLSDQITVGTVGVHLDKPISLQRLQLDAAFTNNQYASNTNFNYTAQKYLAALQWSVTPELHGDVSAGRTDSLVSGANSTDPNKRNLNTQQTSALNAIYGLGGPWRLSAGAVSTTSTNEVALVGQGNDRSSGGNVGVQYAFASGNALSLSSTLLQGNNGSDYNNKTQTLSWIGTSAGKTQLSASVGYQSQTYSALPQYNFNGGVGNIVFNWEASAKLMINTSLQRALASYQTTSATSTQTDTLIVQPTWAVSPKVSFAYTYKMGQRNDMGSPSGVSSGRQDKTQDNGVSLAWKPNAKLTVTLSADDLETTSNVANQNYSVQQLTLGAVYLF